MFSKPELNPADNIWGSLLGGGAYGIGGQPHYLLAVFDIAQQQLGGVATAFLPHGVVLDPLNPWRVALFEKIGPGGCTVDLQQGELEHTLPPAVGHAFYGHGAFSPDGKVLYATETELDSQQGKITVRDGRHLALIGELPSHGHRPHDCQLIEQGRVMVVANAGSAARGEAGCLTWVEVASGYLLEKLPLPEADWNAGHFALNEQGAAALVSAPADGLDNTHCGGVSLRRPGEALHAVTPDPALKGPLLGETLSVAFNQEGTLAVTCTPLGKQVCVWDMHSQTLRKVLPFDQPRGVVLSADGQHFLISYGPNAALMALDARTLSPIGRSYCEQTLLTGSHLWNWQRECQAMREAR